MSNCQIFFLSFNLMALKKFFTSVEENLEEFLNSSVFLEEGIVNIQEAARLLCLAKGSKRIRSEIIYNFGTFFKIKQEILARMASAAELIHAASLLHDDVIDMGIQRRGQPTTNIIYGNTIAVLTGDLLYSQALEFLQGLRTRIFEEAIQVVKKMTIAASSENNQRGNLGISLDTWHNIASGKTAALFSWCASSPAIINETARQDIDLFKKVGHLLGKAFQLADDIKDFFPDGSFGKTTYSDIKNKNPNYILILAMNRSEEFKEKLASLWDEKELKNGAMDEKAKQLGEMIYNSEFFQESLIQLRSWIKQAVQILNENCYEFLSKSIKNLVKKMLYSMSDRVLDGYRKV